LDAKVEKKIKIANVYVAFFHKKVSIFEKIPLSLHQNSE